MLVIVRHRFFSFKSQIRKWLSEWFQAHALDRGSRQPISLPFEILLGILDGALHAALKESPLSLASCWAKTGLAPFDPSKVNCWNLSSNQLCACTPCNCFAEHSGYEHQPLCLLHIAVGAVLDR